MINKVIWFSDLHCGHKEIKNEDINELINNIIKHADNNTVVLFTGDLFHKRVSVDSEAANQAFKLLNTLNQLEVPCVFINGTRSHDYDYISSFVKDPENNSKSDLFPLIDFVATKRNIQIDNINILCCPEEYVDDENLKDYYPEILNNTENMKADITLFHGTLRDVASYNEHIESIPFKKAPLFSRDEMWNSSNIVLCGHIHEEQAYTNDNDQYLSYCGSWGKMEHSTKKTNRLGKMKVLYLTFEEDGTFVKKTDVITNYSTSMFVTEEAIIIDNMLTVSSDNETEVKYDLNSGEDISNYFNYVNTTFTTKGIKYRLKVLNEVDTNSSNILKKIFIDNPLAKVTFVRDVRKIEIKKQQDEMKETIELFNSLPTLEDKVSHFIQNKFGTVVEANKVRDVLTS